jgi:hypothetical protein
MSITFDVKFSTKSSLANLKKVMQQTAKIPDDAYNYFVSITPVDTGNARRSTRKQGNAIQANYAYAQRLDEGYSKQAPKGMSEPTEKFIKLQVQKINSGR